MGAADVTPDVFAADGIAAVAPAVVQQASAVIKAEGSRALLEREDAVALAMLIGMHLPRDPEEARLGEQGVGRIARLKERFGFLNCPEFSDDIFFHFSNVHPEIVEQLHERMVRQELVTANIFLSHVLYVDTASPSADPSPRPPSRL
jgi:hypothetical protein